MIKTVTWEIWIRVWENLQAFKEYIIQGVDSHVSGVFPHRAWKGNVMASDGHQAKMCGEGDTPTPLQQLILSERQTENQKDGEKEREGRKAGARDHRKHLWTIHLQLLSKC